MRRAGQRGAPPLNCGVSRQPKGIAVSRDIFVQDLPPGVASVADIPNDFVPQPLPVTRSQILAAIRAEAPECDARDPTWIRIDSSGKYAIEVNIGNREPLKSFAFHVRGGPEAELLVERILKRLDLRALDSESDSGVFLSDRVPAG
jgi:hypothetical protein